MEVINSLIFPILVRRFKNYLNKQQREDLINYAKDKLSSYGELFKGNGEAITTYSNYKNILDLFGGDFLDNLITELKDYSQEIGFKGTRFLNNSWVSIQKKGSVLKEHVHGSTVVGVFFLKVDSESSPLYLHNPNPYIYLWGYDNMRNHTAARMQVVPEEGDLLLFPGWMSHGSHREANNSEERIICSFNYG